MARTRVCETCDGRGYYYIAGKKKTCDSCLGTKYVGKDAPYIPPPPGAE